MAQVFEYLILSTPSDAEIVSAGENGWELVVVAGQKHYFKRIKIV